MSGTQSRYWKTILNKDKFRILLLADGSAFHTERFLRQLQRQGCHVLLLSLESGNIPHHRLKRRTPLRFLHYLLSVRQIRQAIDRFRPDLISAHFATGYGFTAVLANRKFGLPLALHLWGSDILCAALKSPLHRYKAVAAIRKANLVFADSEYLMDAARRLAPLKKEAVIPWGLEEAFIPLFMLGSKFDQPLKIIVPRAHEEIYDNRFILKALMPLVEANKIEITFPAFGALAEDFAREVKTSSAAGIKMYEKMPRDQFIRFMAGFDVYLSNSKSDSSPVSMIEAMGLGMIPVAADIPGVREWLTPDSGFTYSKGDRQGLRGVIIKILESGSSLDSLRKSNHERVKREAIYENNVASQIELMKQLAGWA